MQRCLLSLCVSLLLLVAHTAEASFSDGELHIVDYPYTLVEVRDGPGGAPTTVRIVDGGDISGFSGYENSIMEVFGGRVLNAVNVRDSARLTVTDGNFNSNNGGLSVFNFASAEVSGGIFHGGFAVTDSGYLSLSGGRALMGIAATQTGTVDWSGGPVFGQVTAAQFGVVNIFGADFELDGEPVSPGPIVGVQPGTTHRLKGRLASGDSIDNWLIIRDATAAIVLIPEPTECQTSLSQSDSLLAQCTADLAQATAESAICSEALTQATADLAEAQAENTRLTADLAECQGELDLCLNPPSACQDGIDNDGDGLVDFGEDPGCRSPDQTSEKSPGR